MSDEQEMTRAYAQKVGEQLRAVRKRKRKIANDRAHIFASHRKNIFQ